jgi:hypothetical protein
LEPFLLNFGLVGAGQCLFLKESSGVGMATKFPRRSSLLMKADRVNAKAGEERKAAMSAKAQLRHLTPSSARTDRIIVRLRHAANVAAAATLNRLDSERALDPIRYAAARSLNVVCRLLDRAHLTQDAIEQASRAVAGWLNALPPQRHDRPTT